MTTRAGRRAAVGLALAAAGASATALTVPELQAMLQAAPVHGVAFEELRESPWLAAPIESRGTMHSTAQGLEKRLVAPREETWRLLHDRMEWIGPGGAASRRILYSEAPAVAVLANALRRVVAADLASLAGDFRIELAGDERQWALKLLPREASVARQLEHLELRGSGARLQVIVVVERQGERTTTTLQP